MAGGLLVAIAVQVSASVPLPDGWPAIDTRAVATVVAFLGGAAAVRVVRVSRIARGHVRAAEEAREERDQARARIAGEQLNNALLQSDLNALRAASVANEPLLAWIRGEVGTDREPNRNLIVDRVQWRHSHVGDASAYIEVGVWLWYAGLFTIEIGTTVSGRLARGADQEFAQRPELRRWFHVEGPPFVLRRGGRVHLLIRQYLGDAEAQEMRALLEPPAKEVELLRGSLRISLAARSFDGEIVHAAHLPLPEYISNINPSERW